MDPICIDIGPYSPSASYHLQIITLLIKPTAFGFELNDKFEPK